MPKADRRRRRRRREHDEKVRRFIEEELRRSFHESLFQGSGPIVQFVPPVVVPKPVEFVSLQVEVEVEEPDP